MSINRSAHTITTQFCPFDINGVESLKERRQLPAQTGHNRVVQEIMSPDGLSLGYYKVSSRQQGKVVIANNNPFLQLSYTISGHKSYHTNSGRTMLASIDKHQYNYLFFPKQEIHLDWQANTQLEIFEMGISLRFFFDFLPEEHPLFPVLSKSVHHNEAALLSKANLPLQANISTILYDMLNCPLEDRYKQLYLKAKTIELLAIQLMQFEQLMGLPRPEIFTRTLRKEDIERMHLARDIIVRNMNSPCTLIDLAHQVGTNDAYLKSHFKQVFGTTVYGYLQNVKMQHAKELLAQGKSISEVTYLSGYKRVSHFARAFKKHFGYTPGILKG